MFAVLQAFLDERGGDFDDCSSFEQLVRPGAVILYENFPDAQLPINTRFGTAAAVGSLRSSFSVAMQMKVQRALQAKEML